MEVKPIIGRTHTDLFRTRNRLTNIGGDGGVNLTFFSANGYSYVQLTIFVVGLLVWTWPLSALGVPILAWGGMSLLLLFGPPVALAWLSDRPMPHGKTFSETITTLHRRTFTEKPYYVAGRPTTSTHTTVSGYVWTPPKEGLRD